MRRLAIAFLLGLTLPLIALLRFPMPAPVIVPTPTPQGADSFQPETLTTPHEGVRVVILGDSTVVNAAALLPSDSACEVVNGAYNAQQAHEAHLRYIQDVVPLKPDAVLVMLPAAHLHFRHPSVAGDDLALYVEAMEVIAAQEDHTLIWLAPPISESESVPQFLPRWANPPISHLEYAQQIDVLNRVLMDRGTRFVPSPDIYMATDFEDATHLNERGHLMMAEWLDEELIQDLCR